MSSAQSSNKRIAKNTLMLYVRMFLSMFVGLYTSRVVLQTLGVEDYGVYGVVGGIVTLFSFLNSSMSGATSRFLTFEIGKNDPKKLSETFSTSLIIHISIAIVVLVLSETIGLWFFYHKLVIPEGRIDAAFWAFQCSILSMIITVTQVPYNACIIAHEKMDVYAYVELLNVFLKLVIVYLLTIGDFDRLILYAVLGLIVAVIIAMTYRVFCLRNFPECHFKWVYKPALFKPMLVFSGWDLYGNVCGIANNQGTTFLLNMFFGPIVNAGANIATTVIGMLSGFSSNVITAFRPQITIRYAEGNIEGMSILLKRAIVYTSFLFGLAVFPIISEMQFVLTLWLGIIPDYAVIFAKIAVFSTFLSNIYSVLLVPLKATGEMKYVSFYGGSLYLLNLIVDYVMLRYAGINPYWVWGINCIFVFLVAVANLLLLKKQIPSVKLTCLVFRSVVPILISSVLLFFIGQRLSSCFYGGWLHFMIILGILTIINVSIYYFFVFDNTERKQLSNIVISYVDRIWMHL